MVQSFDTHLLTLIQNRDNIEEVKSIIEREKLHTTVEKSTNYSLLYYAIQSKNVEIAKYLVEAIKTKQISLLNTCTCAGKTPLEFAALSRCQEIAEFLIEAGADILSNEKKKVYLRSTVRIFMVNNWLDRRMLGKLLKKGDLPNDEEIADGLLENGWPLHCVILLRNANLTKLVLDRQYLSDIDKTDKEGCTALHIAVENADVENVKLLLNYDAIVRVEDKFNFNALWYVYKTSVSVEKNSLIQTSEYKNPTFPNERFAIVKMLLENYGSLLNDNGQIDKNVGQLLMFGNKEVIELLFQSGELGNDLDIIVDGFKYSLFEVIVQNRNPGIIEQLYEKHFDAKNISYMMRAVKANNVTAVEWLLDRGADINAEHGVQRTALIQATRLSFGNQRSKYRDCIQVLLEHGANAQLPTHEWFVDEVEHKQTILHFLAMSANFDISELVLDQLALEKAKGTRIIHDVRIIIQSHEEFRTYYELSQKQLKVEVCKSITLFNLLADSDMKIERYVRNPELYTILTNFNIDESSKFHFFKTFLKKRLKKAVDMVKLRKKAAHIISTIMDKDYERFPLITDQIASYLEKKDMKNLLDVFRNN